MPDTQNTTELLNERFADLPESLVAPLIDGTVADATVQFGQTYNLSPEVEAAVANEITFVLLCFEPYDDFAENLRKVVTLPDQLFTALLEEINKTIFTSVQADLLYINDMREAAEDLATEEPETQTAQINAYTNSDPAIQALYTSSEAETELERIWRTHKLPTEDYPAYTQVVDDVILGIHEVSALPTLLQEKVSLPEKTAFALTSDLLEFLTPRLRLERDGQTAHTEQEEIAVQATPAALTREAANAAPAERPWELVVTPPVTTQPSKAPEPIGVITTETSPDADVVVPTQNEPSVAPLPAEEPAQAIEEPPLIEPVHTMQSDIDLLKARQSNAQVGYNQSQQVAGRAEENTQKAAPVSSIPRYNDNDPSQGNQR